MHLSTSIHTLQQNLTGLVEFLRAGHRGRGSKQVAQIGREDNWGY